jgi:hypothetical protein
MFIFSSTSISCRNWSPNYSVLVTTTNSRFPTMLKLNVWPDHAQDMLKLTFFTMAHSSHVQTDPNNKFKNSKPTLSGEKCMQFFWFFLWILMYNTVNTSEGILQNLTRTANVTYLHHNCTYQTQAKVRIIAALSIHLSFILLPWQIST